MHENAAIREWSVVSDVTVNFFLRVYHQSRVCTNPLLILKTNYARNKHAVVDINYKLICFKIYNEHFAFFL